MPARMIAFLQDEIFGARSNEADRVLTVECLDPLLDVFFCNDLLGVAMRIGVATQTGYVLRMGNDSDLS